MTLHTIFLRDTKLKTTYVDEAIPRAPILFTGPDNKIPGKTDCVSSTANHDNVMTVMIQHEAPAIWRIRTDGEQPEAR